MNDNQEHDITSAPREPHQEWLERLPFFANGTLRGVERDETEAHVATCLTCRAELAAEHRLMQAFRGADAESAQVDDSFAQILARTRAAAVPPPVGVGAARIGRGRRWGATLTRRLALVATLSALVIGLAHWQAGTATVVQSYHTLSQDHGQVVGANVLYVAFEPTLTLGSVEDSLRAVHAEMVSGPTADHVFTVRVPPEHVAQASAALAARQGVRFVAPAAPDAAR